VVAAKFPVVGQSQRLEGRRASRGRAAHRARSADGGVLICIALFVVPLFFLYYLVVGTVGVALAMAIIMIVGVSCFIGQRLHGRLVGSSNNPVSGITICTILFASWFSWDGGGKSSIGAVAVVFIGAVVCNARRGRDNLQDLKAGSWSELLRGVNRSCSASASCERRRDGARDERSFVCLRHRRSCASRRQGAARTAGQFGAIGRRRHVRRHSADRMMPSAP